MTEQKKALREHFLALSGFDKIVIALSIVFAAFVVIDPLTVSLLPGLDPAARDIFKKVTEAGNSAWILIPTGLVAIAFYILWQGGHNRRQVAAYGYLMSLFSFVFVSVAGAGITASLIKNIIGRARPKHFESLGPIAFDPFAFRADFASFPSGHSTTIFALATAIALLWPRTRVVAYVFAVWVAASRFFVGAHYITDAVAGGILGTSFTVMVQKRFLENGWLFCVERDGRVAQRALRVRRWIGAKIRGVLLRKANIPGSAGLSGNS